MTDQEQKEFEAWAESKGMSLERSSMKDYEYASICTDHAYMGYCAGLRAASARVAELEAGVEALIGTILAHPRSPEDAKEQANEK